MATIQDSYADKFNSWSNEMAYWLGFFAADGGLGKRGIRFNLSYKDHYHLVKFCRFMNYDENKIIDFSKEKPFPTQSRVDISSVKIVERLKELGMVRRKSFKNINLMRKVPFIYRLPFIYGYFDGDGCITYGRTHTGVNFHRIVILGNKKTLYSMKYYLVNELRMFDTKLSVGKPLKSNPECNLCKIVWTSYKDIFLFSKKYLKLGDFILDRKKEKIKKFLNKKIIKNVRQKVFVNCVYPDCNKVSENLLKDNNNRFKQNRFGPFCSRSCATKFQHLINKNLILDIEFFKYKYVKPKKCYKEIRIRKYFNV